MSVCSTKCDLPNTQSNELMMVQQLRKEVEAFINSTTTNLLAQDKIIAETCVYIKNNLSAHLVDLFETMQANGDLLDLIREVILGMDGSDVWVNVRSLGAVGDGVQDDTEVIQDALNKYRRVYIPGGTYKLTKPLIVKCGASIKCSEHAVLKSYHDKPFLINGSEKDTEVSGYEGNGNITVDGGIWDNNLEYSTALKGGFAFAHAKNITLKNMTILNTVKTHAVELAGVDGCVIENVKFLGYVKHDSVTYVEAIQIEMCTTGFAYFGKADFTPSKNVTIRECIFDKSEEAGYFSCASGNHAAINDVFIEGVVFARNLVKGCTYAGFRAYCFRDVTVIGNRFIQCERGVMLSGSTGTDTFSMNIYGQQTNIPQSCSDVWIENNLFDGCVTVDIWSNNYKTEEAEAFVRNVHIVNNRMYDCKAVSLYMVRAKEVTITGNHIEGCTGSGMDFNYVSGIVIDGNSIRKPGNYGIMLRDGDTASPVTEHIHICNNRIIECKTTGLNLRNIKVLVVSGNEIVGATEYPILLNNLCAGVNVFGNLLKHATTQAKGYLKIVGDLNANIDVIGNTAIGYNAPDLTEVGNQDTIVIH